MAASSSIKILTLNYKDYVCDKFSMNRSIKISSYWNIVALQYCVSFCYVEKWISHTYIPSLLDFLPH